MAREGGAQAPFHHRLAEFLNAESIDPEITEKLDAIVGAAGA